MESETSDISATLRSARRRAHLSQQELARRQGLPQSQISRAERGEDIRLSTLLQHARGLGLEVVLVPVGSLSAVAALLYGTADDSGRARFMASDERDPE